MAEVIYDATADIARKHEAEVWLEARNLICRRTRGLTVSTAVEHVLLNLVAEIDEKIEALGIPTVSKERSDG